MIRQALRWFHPIAAVLLALGGCTVSDGAPSIAPALGHDQHVSIACDDPVTCGRWELLPRLTDETGTPVPVTESPYHAVLVPTGEVMLWRQNGAATGTSGPMLFEPEGRRLRQLAGPLGPAGLVDNLGCSGHTLLAGGEVLVTGGWLDPGGDINPTRNLLFAGHPRAYTFSPGAGWQSAGEMPGGGRWYPTTRALFDGTVMVASGLSEEVLIEGAGVRNQLNRTIDIFDTESRQWRTAVRDIDLPLYPFLHLLPGGRVLFAGPQPATFALAADGSGRQEVATLAHDHSGGSSLLLPPAQRGRVLVVGGGAPAAPTGHAEVLDMQAGAPAWTAVPDLRHGRHHPNAVILPDGGVLVVGGVEHRRDIDGFEVGLRNGELLDPDSLQAGWQLMAPQGLNRGYHAVALLLPDARVLSLGGDNYGTVDAGAIGIVEAGLVPEIFSPPYLFRGPRPAIDTLSSQTLVVGGSLRVSYGVSSCEGGKKVNEAVLMAPAAVTHSFDMNQRHVPLQIAGNDCAAGSGTLDLVAPADASVLPPAWYMLFLVDGEGIPSIARFVQVQPAARPTVPLYRLAHPAGDHFYTASRGEAFAAARAGYVHEGVAGSCYPAAGVGTRPLYRLYSAAGHDHFYTADPAERDLAVTTHGYADEGIACWIPEDERAGSCPLYRMWSAALSDHFYTPSQLEVQSAAGLGYVYEGVAGRLMQDGGCPP
jgi:hypothetical protein